MKSDAESSLPERLGYEAIFLIRLVVDNYHELHCLNKKPK